MHIILGGTSGLGQQVSTQLRARGERVLVLGRHYDESRDGEGQAVDLYDTDAVSWLTDELTRRLDGEVLQSFVWTAGYGWRGRFADQDVTQSMAEVNFAGALPVVQWAWRRMLKQDIVGQLVVVSSTSGVTPRSDEAVYVATKHAQVGLARSLALEAQEQAENIRVLLCLPGCMKTPFWDGREPDDYATFNDPKKVATKIVDAMQQQVVPYLEVSMPHGTLI